MNFDIFMEENINKLYIITKHVPRQSIERWIQNQPLSDFVYNSEIWHLGTHFFVRLLKRDASNCRNMNIWVTDSEENGDLPFHKLAAEWPNVFQQPQETTEWAAATYM